MTAAALLEHRVTRAAGTIPLAKPVGEDEVTGPYPDLARVVREMLHGMSLRAATRVAKGSVSHDTIARMLHGERPSEAKLDAFARAFSVHPNKLREPALYPLLSDEGTRTAPQRRVPPTANEHKAPYLAGLPDDAARHLQHFLASLPAAEEVRLPLLGRVAAGTPILAVDNIEGYVNVSRDLVHGDADRCFAVRVRGESMAGEHIREGDTLIVREQGQADEGRLVVALIGEEVVVKRLRCENGAPCLESHWSDGRKDRMSPNGWRVIGVVIELRRGDP